MEDRVYKVTVERLNRLQMILLLWGLLFGAYGISWMLETKLGIVVSGEWIMLVMLVALCFCITKLEHIFPSVEDDGY